MMQYIVTDSKSIGRGRIEICLNDKIVFWLYGKEAKQAELLQEGCKSGCREGISLEKGAVWSEEEYRHILHGIIGKRAAKRAMHILERQERTEYQLREKLLQGAYPLEAVEDAVDYVKKYRYLDDGRYARNFIRFHQNTRSRLRLKQDLMRRGISKETIETCLEEEFLSDEREQIRCFLEKKHFLPEEADQNECRRVYQFLQRRGFRSSDILAEMRVKS